jgi:hypothetical protein
MICPWRTLPRAKLENFLDLICFCAILRRKSERRGNQTPVLKEWTCNSCGHQFERIRAECPACESENVKRAFRTPPGIAGGHDKAHSARRTDQILEHQFKKLGIDNFHTMEFGRPNKVSWSPKRFGSRAQPAFGIRQEEIVPSFGVDGMIQAGFNPGALHSTRDTENGVATLPFSIPQDAHGALIPAGIPIGGPPTELLNRTTVIGGIDVHGNQVVRVK